MLRFCVTDVGVGAGHVEVEMVEVEIAPVSERDDEGQSRHLRGKDW